MSTNTIVPDDWKKDFGKIIEETDGTKKRGERGWICPKCGRANAPWKSSCDCTHYVPYTPPYYPIPYHPSTPYITWCVSG